MDGDQAVTDAIKAERFSTGIGCSPRADCDEIVRLIKASLDSIPPDTILATVDRRASIGGVVASILGLQLVLFPASILKDVAGITTYSTLALSRTKTANVAEASALASLGSAASLIVPQRKGLLCTCAVAALRARVRS
jgi:cobalt-precorrin 5A hydrolase